MLPLPFYTNILYDSRGIDLRNANINVERIFGLYFTSAVIKTNVY